MSPTIVAAYLALFFLVGATFLFVNLLIGKLLRPKNPNEEKLSVYECGEPTIGSSFVQFDLRFYVVALLFIIFDVEVAFFFPWAAAYGKATHLMDPNFKVAEAYDSKKPEPAPVGPAPVAVASAAVIPADQARSQLTKESAAVFRELGVKNPAPRDVADDPEKSTAEIRSAASTLAKTSIADILVFFAVLMVGFAYVWSRGDLDWVRAVTAERSQAPTLKAVGVDDGSETVLAG
jgi:NADH-quinone oxidoreductase subunit A